MKFLKTAWTNIRRSPYQALAAIVIITQTFFVVSLFTLVIAGSSKIISYFEQSPQVTAFFKNDTKQEDINGLKSQIQQTGKAAKIHIVSQEEAFQRFKQFNKDQPDMLELVSPDILPSSIEVSTQKIDDLSSIATIMQNDPHVQQVVFYRDLVAKLESWTNFLRKFGVALILVLALDSIFIMLIIISIKISQKREDIEIMRLIGASKWYIRWPFVLEGIIYGFIGAFFGWILSIGVLLYSSPIISQILQGIPILPVSPLFLLEILVLEFVFALILGLISSYLAVLRYLK